jgi:hypothetical protein
MTDLWVLPARAATELPADNGRNIQVDIFEHDFSHEAVAGVLVQQAQAQQ